MLLFKPKPIQQQLDHVGTPCAVALHIDVAAQMLLNPWPGAAAQGFGGMQKWFKRPAVLHTQEA
jgi:hypothetical protein